MTEHTSSELGAAVARYQADLWPRGNEAVLASLENTNLVHDWSTMLQSPLFTGGLAKDAGKKVVVEEQLSEKHEAQIELSEKHETKNELSEKIAKLDV